MLKHTDISKETLLHLIRRCQVTMAGNRKLKIYGTLKCSSGKRMKKENRVFFTHADEAIQAGFHPCGHCLKGEYLRWKFQNPNVKSQTISKDQITNIQTRLSAEARRGRVR